MREREPGGRLRVVIAGNIYAKRALVRRFLEDDGFDVVGEALSQDQLLTLGGLPRADAVVVDGDLLDGSVETLRGAAPDAAIVVFTSAAGVTNPPGADGYLEKGMGLASLTALLHSLLSEPPATPLGHPWPTPPAPLAPPPERRVLAGLAGVAAGVVLVAVVALAVFGGAGTVPISNPIALPTSSPTAAPAAGRSALELATADLHELQKALADGRVIEARYVLQDLNAILSAAHPTFATGAFLAFAADELLPFLDGLSADLLADLKAVFGSALQIPTSTGSVSGGTILTGVTPGSTTTTAGTTSGGTATGGTTSGGTTTTGGGSGTGDGGGSGGGSGSGDGSGGGSGGGGDQPVTSHGNGHHFGWVNRPPAGGWHGTKPHPTNDGASNAGTTEPGAGAANGGGHGVERPSSSRYA
ncbi:MAG: hypothetical protein ACXVP7_03475 [Actinomycetota bacterium]